MSPIARQAEGTEFHYKPGDFGLIPRPEQRIQTNIEKMHELSQTTRLGTLKKVLTRSIGVQTISSPKVSSHNVRVYVMLGTDLNEASLRNRSRNTARNAHLLLLCCEIRSIAVRTLACVAGYVLC